MFDENKWTETDGMEKEKKIDTAAQNGSAEQPSEQNSGMSVQNSGSADQSGLEQISGAGSGIRGTGSDSTGQGVTDCGQTYGNAGQNQGYGSTGQGQPDQSRNYGSQAQGQSAQHPNYGHAGQGYANPGYGSYQGQGYGQSVQGQTLQGYSQPGQTNAPYSQNQQAGQGYGWPQYTQDPRSRMRYPEQGMYDYYGRANSGSSDNQEAAQKSGKGAGVDKTKKRSFVRSRVRNYHVWGKPGSRYHVPTSRTGSDRGGGFHGECPDGFLEPGFGGGGARCGDDGCFRHCCLCDAIGGGNYKYHAISEQYLVWAVPDI